MKFYKNIILTATATSALLFTGCSTRKVEVQNKVVHILDAEKENIQKLKYDIGEIEWNNFINFFNFRNYKDITNKLNKIQKSIGIKKSSIKSAFTLKYIYKNYYSKNLENCSQEIKERWVLHKSMLEYPKHKSFKGDSPKMGGFNSRGGVFDYMFYYGHKSLGQNYESTHIKENLIGVLPNTITNKKPIIKINNYDGKTTLAYYDKGILKVGTYVSPGRLTAKSPDNKQYNNKGRTYKYYISSSTKRPGSIMPFAIGIDENKGIYIHMTNHKLTGYPESGGCFRIDGENSQMLYYLIKLLKSGDLTIEIGDIY